MKFTFLAHASLSIEHGGTSVLVDPWLMGGAYDGAWRLVPEPEGLVERVSRPDYVALTHGHPDHLHVPTLTALRERFGRRLTILVPSFIVGRMPEDLARLGFTDVRELPLGRPMALGPDLSLAVHASRADDSAQIFRGGGRTLLNTADCRLEGRLLRAIADEVGSCDFCFGQIAPADGYPFCLDGYPEAEMKAASREPLHRFLETCRAVGARHAVPIGSLIRFSHEDNAHLNRWLPDLEELDADPVHGSSLAVLFPGDGFSEEGGIRREGRHRDRYRLAAQEVRSQRAPLTPRRPAPPLPEVEAAAHERITDMLERLPSRLRRSIGRLGFHLHDLDRALTVDWVGRELRWSSGPPPLPYYRLGAGIFVEVCRTRWGFGNLHIAGCFSVHGWREGRAVERFMPLSILYGLGYFDSAGGYLQPRALRATWARRAELTDFLARFARGRAWADDGFRRL